MRQAVLGRRNAQVTYDDSGQATSVAIDGAPQFVMQQVRRARRRAPRVHPLG